MINQIFKHMLALRYRFVFCCNPRLRTIIQAIRCLWRHTLLDFGLRQSLLLNWPPIICYPISALFTDSVRPGSLSDSLSTAGSLTTVSNFLSLWRFQLTNQLFGTVTVTHAICPWLYNAWLSSRHDCGWCCASLRQIGRCISVPPFNIDRTIGIRYHFICSLASLTLKAAPRTAPHKFLTALFFRKPKTSFSSFLPPSSLTLISSFSCHLRSQKCGNCLLSRSLSFLIWSLFKHQSIYLNNLTSFARLQAFFAPLLPPEQIYT